MQNAYDVSMVGQTELQNFDDLWSTGGDKRFDQTILQIFHVERVQKLNVQREKFVE